MTTVRYVLCKCALKVLDTPSFEFKKDFSSLARDIELIESSGRNEL